MKKNGFVCAGAALVMLFTACSKKNVELENETESVPSGVVLLNGTGLYTQQDDGKMKYSASADAGDILALVLVKNEDKKVKSVEVKTAERTDGQKRDFIHVMKDDKDVWIQTALFAPNTRPVVITSNEAVMYKSTDISGVLGNTYPQYLIAAAGETKNGFVQIYAYIEGSLSAGSAARFVKQNCVSFDATDVKAMQLLNAAKISKNNTAKKELLHNALALNSSFSGMIREAYNSAFPDEADNGGESDGTAGTAQNTNGIEPNATVSSDDGSLINVRADSNVNAEVIKQLSGGSSIYYTGISDSSDEVDGVTDYWYKITYPVEGWVFGEFVNTK